MADEAPDLIYASALVAELRSMQHHLARSRAEHLERAIQDYTAHIHPVGVVNRGRLDTLRFQITLAEDFIARVNRENAYQVRWDKENAE